MPTAHLICGSTGAGKTTYARALAERIPAVRLTADEWMAAFFWPDAPEPVSFAWALERVERCERQALVLAEQLQALEITLVLDYGFFTREQRLRIGGALAEAGWQVRLHYLPLPAEERWSRVTARNAEGGETYALTVSRAMFDFCETLFEAPDVAELAGAVIHR